MPLAMYNCAVRIFLDREKLLQNMIHWTENINNRHPYFAIVAASEIEQWFVISERSDQMLFDAPRLRFYSHCQAIQTPE